MHISTCKVHVQCMQLEYGNIDQRERMVALLSYIGVGVSAGEGRERAGAPSLTRRTVLLHALALVSRFPMQLLA